MIVVCGWPLGYCGWLLAAFVVWYVVWCVGAWVRVWLTRCFCVPVTVGAVWCVVRGCLLVAYYPYTGSGALLVSFVGSCCLSMMSGSVNVSLPPLLSSFPRPSVVPFDVFLRLVRSALIIPCYFFFSLFLSSYGPPFSPFSIVDAQANKKAKIKNLLHVPLSTHSSICTLYVVL